MKRILNIAIITFLFVIDIALGAPSLELFVKSEKPVYVQGENVILEATLKNNTSDKEIVFFWVYKAPQLAIEGSHIAISMLRTFNEDEMRDLEYFFIQPGKSVTKRIMVHNALAPSLYKLTLFCECYKTISDFKIDPAQLIWEANILSKAIDLRIIEKP